MVERFEDIYTLRIEGNFEHQLTALQREIEGSRGAWADLRKDLTRGANVFKAVEKSTKGAADGQKDLAKASHDLAPEMEKLAGSSVTAARAYNSLVRSQNRLNEARAAELQVLRQESSQKEPNIIATRAETRAVRAVTKALEEATYQRRLQQLAEQAGLTLTAGSAKLFNAQAIAMERAARAAQQLAVSEELRKLGLDDRGNFLVEGPKTAAEAGYKQTQEQAKAFDAQAEATKRATRALQELQTIEALRNRGLDPRGRGLLQGPLTADAAKAGLSQQDALEAERAAILADRKRTTDEYTKSLRAQRDEGDKFTRTSRTISEGFNSIGVAASKTNTILGHFLFTFRRLVGVLAVFAVARHVARGFTEMVAGAVKFNAQLERNRVGMAGLIAASGQVLDAQGNRLPIEQQLNVAQDLAIQQMRELRRDAIRTVATYEDLAEAFSQSIAPGISAGLDIDTIRQITVTISQAAAGLGLAQNQLSEEIRSLFQGTITPRNTRIATALGITNEDIRRAKELGNLGTFLKNRFEAISKSGKRLTDTFDGQVNAARDAFKQLIAESSKPLFGQLKAGLKDFNTQIFEDLKDEPIINPDSLKLFDQLFQGIAQGVRNIRASFSDLNIQGFSDTFGLIGRSIGLIATALGAALSSAFKIASPLLTVFNTILNVLSSTFTVLKAINQATGGFASSIGFAALRIGALIYGFRKLWSLLKTIVVASRAFSAAMAGMTLVATAAEARFVGIYAAIVKIRAALVVLSKPLRIAAVALAAVDQLLRFSGISDGAFGLVGKVFAKVNSAIDGVLDSWVGLNEEADNVSTEAPGLIADGFKDIADQIQRVTDAIRVDLIGSLASFSDEVQALKLTPAGADQLLSLSQVLSESASIFKDAQDRLAAGASETLQLKGLRAEQYNRLELATARTRELFLQSAALREELDELNRVKLFEFPVGGGENFLRLTQRISDIQDTIREKEKDLEAARSRELGVAKEIERVSGRTNQLLEEEKTLTEELGKLQSKNLEKQAQILRKLTESRVAEIEVQSPGNQIAAIRERAVTDLLRIGDEGRVRVLDSLVAARSRELEALEQQQRRANDIYLLDKERRNFASTNTTFAATAAKAAERQLVALRQQNVELTKAENAQIARLKEEARLARLREEGGIGDGFSETIRKLANEKDSLFLVGESLAEGIFTGIPQTLGGIVSTALQDGFSSADVQQAFQTLLFGSIGQFVQDLATAFLANLFVDKTADTGKLAAELAAVSSASIALSEAASSAAIKISGSLVAGAAAVSFSAGLLLAAATALKAANPLGGIASLFGSATGGRIWSNHGNNVSGVQGFARGGTPRRRPLGVDARDTIPALLRPGEWVIRPEAVRHYGHRLFSMLNGRKINRSALSGIKAASAPSVSPPRSGGYATGGPVGRSPSTRESGSSVQTVLQFHDEQTMDRALAAGPQSMVRFTRSRRAQMRSALGLQEN